MKAMIDTFVETTLAEKYRIDSVMRESDLGRIYHATHLLMEKPVAIKVLSPALAVDENIVKRFSLEARNVSTLSHPNILGVTDFGADANGTVYIVFEDADGMTLKETIAVNGKFAPDHAVRIARQISSALAAAHARGLIHGNLNSSNILLTGEDDHVKLLELGAVRPDSLATDDDVTDSRIEYLSPEQCADAASADQRSDIYSVGVLLYEMLAGEPPFRAETTSELMMKHAQEPPPPLSAFRADLPNSVEPLILQALAKNPDMRHQSATELFDDLNRVERKLLDLPNTAAAAASPNNNNNIWKTAFVVLAGISLLSVFLIWATRSKQTEPSTLQADSNSQPLQPVGPASGLNEQGLATIVPMTQDSLSNSNMTLQMPDTLPGGDGYNPWGNGVQPPAGGPPQSFPAPTGYYDVNPNSTSPFNPDDGGNIIQGPDGKMYYVVPDANNTAKPTPTPKAGKTPAANTAVSPTPATTDTTKPAATPVTDPKATPAKTPEKPADKTKTPPATTKTATSGKTQDS